jgi:hydroxyacyl-ACP dehydratase HTD2-like protein with hotdog domain
MSVDSSFIGKSSPPHIFQVTRENVLRFMEATGDPALQSNTPVEYAPPTFPTTFRIRISELGLDASTMQLLHGEQSYDYSRRLRIGDEITCVARISDIRQRMGRSGPMTIIVTETTGIDSAQQHVFTAHSTAVVRAK